ncbi:MAG TPA: Hsp20/alpha crystallin family protein [Verrucomicrobiota bacterium]|nr:heat-shock protein Hsp20 [Verrucomicrobiales bacterium]HRI14729.1 Hsp20/alpha crystallin family protein [Verrucomicrobiota bacterium]
MNSLVTRRSAGYPVSPLASLLNLGRDFDRLFEAPFAAVSREGLQTAFAPAIELREDADNVSVSVELPGVDKKDVSVTIHDGVLTISGERKQEREVTEDQQVRSERYYGRFERQVGLTQPVVGDKVKAVYKDGVLTITLPKAAEAKPKSIDITAN